MDDCKQSFEILIICLNSFNGVFQTLISKGYQGTQRFSESDETFRHCTSVFFGDNSVLGYFSNFLRGGYPKKRFGELPNKVE